MKNPAIRLAAGVGLLGLSVACSAITTVTLTEWARASLALGQGLSKLPAGLPAVATLCLVAIVSISSVGVRLASKAAKSIFEEHVEALLSGTYPWPWSPGDRQDGAAICATIVRCFEEKRNSAAVAAFRAIPNARRARFFRDFLVPAATTGWLSAAALSELEFHSPFWSDGGADIKTCDAIRRRNEPH